MRSFTSQVTFNTVALLWHPHKHKQCPRVNMLLSLWQEQTLNQHTRLISYPEEFGMIFSGMVTWMWNQWKFRGLVLHTADIWHLWTMMSCQDFHQGKWWMSSCHTWHIKLCTPHYSYVVHHIPSQFHLCIQGFKLSLCPKFTHLGSYTNILFLHMYIPSHKHQPSCPSTCCPLQHTTRNTENRLNNPIVAVAE